VHREQVLIPARDKNATINVPEVASNFRRQGTTLAISETNVCRRSRKCISGRP